MKNIKSQRNITENIRTCEIQQNFSESRNVSIQLFKKSKIYNKIHEKLSIKVKIFQNMIHKHKINTIKNIYKLIKNGIHSYENMHKSCKTLKNYVHPPKIYNSTYES